MRFTLLRRLAVTAAVTLPLSLSAASALAGDALEVKSGETVHLAGTLLYKTVTVRAGGTLVVRSMGDGAPGTGSLFLRAESVTVEKDGVIDARGAGYPGTNGGGSAPACCSTAGGGAGLMGPTASPGGGGANGGDGAPGCTPGGAGGAKLDTTTSPTPGSAGGASFFPAAAGDEPNRGGSGGGVVSILATTVTIDGSILADGAPGLSYGGVGTGGGAGGYIAIDAIQVLGAGTLSAQGGAGGVGFAASGGGGGGGVIQVTSKLALPVDGLPARLVAGGPTGAAGSTCPAGGSGVEGAAANPDKPCNDADEDSDPAAGCMGGTDCDDGDPTVRGGSNPGIEICDGLDNDCDGTPDNELVTDACPTGQSCQGGVCQDDGNGTGGAGGGDASAPDYLDYRGACDMSGPGRGAHTNGMIFFATALVGFLAGIRAHLKKRR